MDLRRNCHAHHFTSHAQSRRFWLGHFDQGVVNMNPLIGLAPTYARSGRRLLSYYSTRAAMLRHEPLGTSQIHALRDGAHAPQPQIDRHPLAQHAHGPAPFRSSQSDIECRRGMERISVGMTSGDRERCFDRDREASMTSSPLPRSGFAQTCLSDSGSRRRTPLGRRVQSGLAPVG